MANLIKTRRGLDIPVAGKAVEMMGVSDLPKLFAIIPDNYHGITPKMLVKEGEAVKAGTPVFYDKRYNAVNFVSPVSGILKAVNRGERRKIMNIIIESDGKMDYEAYDKVDAKADAQTIIASLCKAGLWAFVKQRPYDVIANPNVLPKAIFISTFDTAPLAPNNDYVLSSQMSDFQAAVSAFSKIAKVNLGVRSDRKTAFSQIKDAEITQFKGPHPVGNVGIQINKLNPVNKGEVVWTIGVQDVAIIGKFLNTGLVDMKRTIALTGPEVLSPQYYQTIIGANVESLLQGKVSSGKTHRFICGNVLTGIKIKGNGWLDPYATQLTVIQEGNNIHELFGWIMPRFDRFSSNDAYSTKIFNGKIMGALFGKINYKWDTRLLGGSRYIIVSNEYDKVLPMDIYPEFLFKAMIAGNLDKMEALGAYEIAPEDVALCEFVCTSKLQLQQLVRTSLDFMRNELE